jgi:hypothetical protein
MWSTGIGVKITLRNILAFLTLLMVSHISYSAELFGTVDSLSGSAFVLDQHGKSTAVSIGMKIYEGQTINSGPDGEVHLVSEDGGIIALRPDSVFRVDEYKAEGSSADKIFMTLLSGAMRSITGWIGKHGQRRRHYTENSARRGRCVTRKIRICPERKGGGPDLSDAAATLLGQAQTEDRRANPATQGILAWPFGADARRSYQASEIDAWRTFKTTCAAAR